jgi:hypothetical protein
VPYPQRVRADQEALPQVQGEHPSRRREEGPVRRGEGDPLAASEQDLELVPEHRVLEIRLIEAAADEQAEQPTQKPVPDGPKHLGSLMLQRPACGLPAQSCRSSFFTSQAFQLALALGAPLGRAAWGGTQTHLPMDLRIASGFAVGVWVLAALIVLGRGGFKVSPLPLAFLRGGTWTLVGVSALATLMNLASSSSWERFVWAPVALILAVLCFVVARGPASEGAGRGEPSST